METIGEKEEIEEENLGVREQTKEDDNEIGNMVDPYYKLQKNSLEQGNLRERQCYDLAKQLSQYLFSFLFYLFIYQQMHEIKVTHREAQDFSIGLGLLCMYI